MMLCARRGCAFRKLSSLLFTSAATLPFLAAAAMSQEPEEVEELPPVVVEGATLAKPPAAKKSGTQAGPASPATANASATATGSGPASGTGSATGDGEDVAGVPINQLGASITVVTRKELQEQQIRYAADALRSLPGVEVTQSGGPGNLTQVRIRGAEANQTLVLIDGIEVNNPTDGAFDFSNLSAYDIERIEVIRGPMSGIYGSNAVGGVINIITNGGRGPLTFTARGEGGSFSTSGVAGSVSAGNDKGHFAINYNRRETDGFNISPFGDEDDGSRLSTFSVRAGFTAFENLSVNFALRNMDKEGDRDAFDGAVGELATALDDPSWFTSDTWLAGVNIKLDTFDGHLTHVLRANRNATTTTDTDLMFPASPFFSRNDSELIKYGYLATYRFNTPLLLAAHHSLSGLVEREDENFTPLGDFGDGIERSRLRNAIVGEYHGGFADTVFITANIRHDDNDTFQDFTTWRSAISVPLKSVGMRPHASVGTAVKFPTMFEQFGVFPGFFVPNPNLVPEESFGWDAGVEFTFANGDAILDVTYFEANLKNEIMTVDFPSTPINLDGESKRKGVEVGARARLGGGLTIGAAYTYLNAKDPDGLEKVRRPPHAGRVEVNYAFAQGKGNLNFKTIYTGSQQDLGFRLPFFTQERVALDSYWLGTIAASYEIMPGVEMFGRVENLFDDDYQEIFGFEAAQIAAYAGVRLTYEDLATAAWTNGK
ncbi:MAG: TonB-dependent receptor plug domain-containing protein [Hyphomicrobium sp.]